jgi:hypothetical protein
VRRDPRDQFLEASKANPSQSAKLQKELTQNLSSLELPCTFDIKHFDPERSKKNIGNWKHSPLQKQMRLIEKELSEYLVSDSSF